MSKRTLLSLGTFVLLDLVVIGCGPTEPFNMRGTEKSTDSNDLVYYAKSDSYLTSQLCRYGEYASAQVFHVQPEVYQIVRVTEEFFGRSSQSIWIIFEFDKNIVYGEPEMD